MTELFPWLLLFLGLALVVAVYAYNRYSRIQLQRHLAELAHTLSPTDLVRVDGFDIHFVQAGRGPHLILLHGIGASTFCWRHIFAPLAEHFTVTALDLPGFGQSSKSPRADYGLDAQTRRLLEFFDRLGIDEAHLVGSSMGGALALWLAKLYPERFKMVATISPAIHPKVIPLNLSQISFLAPWVKYGVNATLIRQIMKKVVAHKENITPATVAKNLEPYENNSAAIAAFIKSTDLLDDHRLPEELSDLKSKLLCLWGQLDLITPVSQIKEIQAYLPQAEYRVHPSGGHHLMEDEPVWVAESLIQFFINKKNLQSKI